MGHGVPVLNFPIQNCEDERTAFLAPVLDRAEFISFPPEIISLLLDSQNTFGLSCCRFRHLDYLHSLSELRFTFPSK